MFTHDSEPALLPPDSPNEISQGHDVDRACTRAGNGLVGKFVQPIPGAFHLIKGDAEPLGRVEGRCGEWAHNHDLLLGREKAHLPNQYPRSAGIEIGQEPAGGDWHTHQLTLKGGLPIETSAQAFGIDAKRHAGNLLSPPAPLAMCCGSQFPSEGTESRSTEGTAHCQSRNGVRSSGSSNCPIPSCPCMNAASSANVLAIKSE